ncbi:MAG: hypothetical protein R3D00_23335 [Bacteroidia bacterium]
MKHVFSNRLLGPVVLSIWAGVVFRFADGLQLNDGPVLTHEEDLTIVPVIEFGKNPELLLNYGDPFAGFDARKVSGITSLQPQLFPQKPVPPPPSIPDIAYLGGVSHNTEVSLTGVVAVSGRNRMIREGDTLKGFLISKLTPDFVRLGTGSQSMTIKKQNLLTIYP